MDTLLHRLNIVFWTPLLLGLFIPVGAVVGFFSGAFEAIRVVCSSAKRNWR